MSKDVKSLAHTSWNCRYWIFIKKEEQLSSKLVRPPIGSKTGSTYRYLWPVIREGVAFAPAQRPPPLRFKA